MKTVLVKLGIRSSTLGQATNHYKGDIIAAALAAAWNERLAAGMTERHQLPRS